MGIRSGTGFGLVLKRNRLNFPGGEVPQQPRWTEYVPLNSVLRATRNPKLHDTEVIRASIGRFGVVELPAMDERTGRLVAGHGRLDEWQRAQSAGEDPPDGVKAADDGVWHVPVLRGWRSNSDAEAEAYLVVSNRSTELGGWDDIELSQVLHDLRDNDLLEFTGYDDDDVAAFDAEPSGAGVGDGDDDDPHPEPHSVYGVLVLCDNPREQGFTIEALSEQGYRCQPASSSSSVILATTETRPPRATTEAAKTTTPRRRKRP